MRTIAVSVPVLIGMPGATEMRERCGQFAVRRDADAEHLPAPRCFRLFGAQRVITIALLAASRHSMKPERSHTMPLATCREIPPRAPDCARATLRIELELRRRHVDGRFPSRSRDRPPDAADKARSVPSRSQPPARAAIGLDAIGPGRKLTTAPARAPRSTDRSSRRRHRDRVGGSASMRRRGRGRAPHRRFRRNPGWSPQGLHGVAGPLHGTRKRACRRADENLARVERASVPRTRRRRPARTRAAGERADRAPRTARRPMTGICVAL